MVILRQHNYGIGTFFKGLVKNPAKQFGRMKNKFINTGKPLYKKASNLTNRSAANNLISPLNNPSYVQDIAMKRLGGIKAVKAGKFNKAREVSEAARKDWANNVNGYQTALRNPELNSQKFLDTTRGLPAWKQANIGTKNLIGAAEYSPKPPIAPPNTGIKGVSMTTTAPSGTFVSYANPSKY